MFELLDTVAKKAVIRVIGVGGGGGNAVSHMIRNGMEGVDFICANTDAQALDKISQDLGASAATMLQIGSGLTGGLGAGSDASVGRNAALEDKERIAEAIEGTQMLFIAAGMGGGTGTGAAPVVADIARDKGILTVAVVTKPFGYEGTKRMRVAEDGIAELDKSGIDSIITIPNENIFEALGKGVTIRDAFASIDNVLYGAVRGIAELITRPGYINVDFADVCSVMSQKGTAIIGCGVASGEDRATRATEEALHGKLLEAVDLKEARAILINIAASSDSMRIDENRAVSDMVNASAGKKDVHIISGMTMDDSLGDELRVTVVVTGLSRRSGNQSGRGNLKVVRRPGDLDEPTHRRGKMAEVPAADVKQDEKWFDAPAFIRRQAD